MIETLGFTSLVPADNDFAPLSMGQLTHGATVREMTAAFTMFPNAGQHTTLRTYSRVYDRHGNILLDNRPQFTRALSEVNAYWMTDMLVESVVNGTGRAAILPNRMPVAGKTGTTTDRQDRWFVGFTPYFVAGVWTGFDTPANMTSSGNPAAQIWQRVMARIHENLEVRQFNRPEITTLPPVAGTNPEIARFVIQAIDLYGNIIEEFPGWAGLGTERTVSAPEIEGYTLVGESSRTLFIFDDPYRNVAVFIYTSAVPPGGRDPDLTDEPPYGEHSTDPTDPTESPTSPWDQPPDYTAPTDPPATYPPITTDPPATEPPEEDPRPPQLPTQPPDSDLPPFQTEPM